VRRDLLSFPPVVVRAVSLDSLVSRFSGTPLSSSFCYSCAKQPLLTSPPLMWSPCNRAPSLVDPQGVFPGYLSGRCGRSVGLPRITW